MQFLKRHFAPLSSLIVLLVFSSPVHAEEFQGPGEGLNAFKSQGAETFCRENLREEMAMFSFQISEKTLQSILKIGGCPSDLSPWNSSLYPDERTRLCNHNSQYFVRIELRNSVLKNLTSGKFQERCRIYFQAA